MEESRETYYLEKKKNEERRKKREEKRRKTVKHELNYKSCVILGKLVDKAK